MGFITWDYRYFSLDNVSVSDDVKREYMSAKVLYKDTVVMAKNINNLPDKQPVNPTDIMSYLRVNQAYSSTIKSLQDKGYSKDTDLSKH